MNSFFEYHCGFLDEQLQFVAAENASSDLRERGLFHSWFRWKESPTKSEVFESWRQRFGKDSLLLARADSTLDAVLTKIFEDMGVEVRTVDGITDTEKFETWIRDNAIEYQLTDPKFACLAYLSEVELKNGREVLWTFPVFEIKDMNWQFTDPTGTEEIITQDQPHWVINDFATTLTPYLLKKAYPQFHWGLALELIPDFASETGIFNQFQKSSQKRQKYFCELELAQWLDPQESFSDRTTCFFTPPDTELVPPKGRSYNLPGNSMFPGA